MGEVRVAPRSARGEASHALAVRALATRSDADMWAAVWAVRHLAMWVVPASTADREDAIHACLLELAERFWDFDPAKVGFVTWAVWIFRGMCTLEARRAVRWRRERVLSALETADKPPRTWDEERQWRGPAAPASEAEACLNCGRTRHRKRNGSKQPHGLCGSCARQRERIKARGWGSGVCWLHGCVLGSWHHERRCARDPDCWGPASAEEAKAMAAEQEQLQWGSGHMTAKALQRWRGECSIPEAAKELQVSAGTYRQWERGERQPTRRANLRRLWEVLTPAAVAPPAAVAFDWLTLIARVLRFTADEMERMRRA